MINKLLILIGVMCMNYSYGQKNIDSTCFNKKIYKNLSSHTALNLQKTFISDTLTAEGSTTVSALSTKSGHIIRYSMKFSSISKDVPIEANLENLISSTLTINNKVFNCDDIDLYSNKTFVKLGNLPLDFLSVDADGDSGNIKYYKDRDGAEYLLIKAGILGCNGFNCGGYYILIVKIIEDKIDLKVFNYPTVFPLSFDSVQLFTLKNGYPHIIVYNAENKDGKVESTVNSISLKDFKLEKAKDNGLLEIQYEYNLWKKQNLKILSWNWY